MTAAPGGLITIFMIISRPRALSAHWHLCYTNSDTPHSGAAFQRQLATLLEQRLFPIVLRFVSIWCLLTKYYAFHARPQPSRLNLSSHRIRALRQIVLAHTYKTHSTLFAKELCDDDLCNYMSCRCSISLCYSYHGGRCAWLVVDRLLYPANLLLPNLSNFHAC